MLYKADILAICPNAKAHIVDAMVDEGYNGAWERFGVTTPVSQAKFMGQIVHESANLTRLEEKLRYSAKRLCEVWPKRFKSEAMAQPFAFNPQALANKVYGGRLGNDKPGDGYRYRGRGLKQTTGKYNYGQAGKELGLDLVAQPDLLLHANIGFLIGLAYWKEFIGAKAETASVKEITKIVNGGYNGLADRENATERAEDVLSYGTYEREILTETALELLDPGRIVIRELKKGSKGIDVRLLQAQLVELGNTISIDGDFGVNTTNALKEFQVQNELEANGIYDSKTRNALQLSLQEQRLAADPTTTHQAPDLQPEQPPSLPDFPLEAALSLTANIVIGAHGDIMGVNEVQPEKLTKIKRYATVLWGQIKDLGESRETAVALTNLETAIMWATKSVARQAEKHGA